MSKKLKYLSGLLKKTDSELYEHLEVYEMENLYYKFTIYMLVRNCNFSFLGSFSFKNKNYNFNLTIFCKIFLSKYMSNLKGFSVMNG
jgi:hypothetical protein